MQNNFNVSLNLIKTVFVEINKNRFDIFKRFNRFSNVAEIEFHENLQNYTKVRALKMVNVLQSIDSGHEDLIHGAEIDYYGLNLATCASDNSVKVKKF